MMSGVGSGFQLHHTLPIQYNIDPTLSVVGGENSPPVQSSHLNDPGLNDTGVTDTEVRVKSNRSRIVMILIIVGILFGIVYLIGAG